MADHHTSQHCHSQSHVARLAEKNVKKLKSVFIPVMVISDFAQIMNLNIKVNLNILHMSTLQHTCDKNMHLVMY